MAVMAFVTWLITAVGGLGLVSIWIIERDEAAAASRLPRTVVGGHGLLAILGLAVWAMYLFMDMKRTAWVAVAILAVVFALGATMAARWAGVYRAHRNRSPVFVAAGPGTAGIERPPPPERHLPIALVIAHGVMAAVTIALVLLTALDIGGS